MVLHLRDDLDVLPLGAQHLRYAAARKAVEGDSQQQVACSLLNELYITDLQLRLVQRLPPTLLTADAVSQHRTGQHSTAQLTSRM